MLRQIGLACLVVVAATAAVANKIDDCRQGRNSEASVRACSEVIAGAGYSADERALAYQRRGNARVDAGAGAQAVADFMKPSVFVPMSRRPIPIGVGRSCLFKMSLGRLRTTRRLCAWRRLRPLPMSAGDTLIF